MKRNYYILIAMVLVWMKPLSMQAFGTTPTDNFTTNKNMVAGCAGVTVVGGSGSITLTGLGIYSHIIVFTPDFARKIYNNSQVSTATLNIPMTTAGNYIVKVWSNPDPAAPCENNFNVTVTATTTGGGNICTNTAANIVGGAGSIAISGITSSCAVVQVFNSNWSVVYNQQTSGTAVTVPNLAAGSYIVKVTVLGTGCKWTPQCVVQSTVKVADSTTGGGTCTEYNIANANDCASGFWHPYSMYVAGVFYQIRDGKFRKNSDGTATLTANYTLDGWSTAATAKVTFTGMTTTTPVGSPKHSTCTQGTPTTDWTYYTAFTGTVTINGVAQTISRRGEAFQVGTGANGQNKGDLGASGWFTLGNGFGDFNFRLSGGTSCSSVSAYLVKDDQISMRAAVEVNRSRVEWTNNTGYKNDFFTLEKENPITGNFETLSIINNKYASDINEYYTIYDNAPTKGDNVYRVKVTYVDGTSKISEVQTVKFNASEGIRLFPNPANEMVGIDLTNYKGQAVTISLYNQFGQHVLTQHIEKAAGTVNLDVSQNTTGNYVIRVVSKGRKNVIQQLHIAK
jgi:Secretion system C-terminal sorting domain